MPPLQIENVTRGTLIVTQGRAADSYFPRLIGLMGHAPLAAGEGLLITRSNSIHTHFMRFPIDVLYVSNDDEVVAIDHAMAPWRFGRIHRNARYVVELPAGTATTTGTEVGDRIEVSGAD